jgi:hypothetical protein
MNTHKKLVGLYVLHYTSDIIERNTFDTFQLEKNGQQVIFAGCKHWVMFYSVHSCVIISEDSGLGLDPDLINLHLDMSIP